jgi:hypothetical protein
MSGMRMQLNAWMATVRAPIRADIMLTGPFLYYVSVVGFAVANCDRPDDSATRSDATAHRSSADYVNAHELRERGRACAHQLDDWIDDRNRQAPPFSAWHAAARGISGSRRSGGADIDIEALCSSKKSK